MTIKSTAAVTDNRDVEEAKAMMKDITGQQFGLLTALEPTEKRDGSAVIWRCRCNCGKTVERSINSLNENSGCDECRPRGYSLRKDYSGQRFGRLVALECTGKHKGKQLIWLFQCDCGRKIEFPLSNVIGGSTKSCGCLKKDVAGKNNSNYSDLTGKQFGCLTVEGVEGSGKRRELIWRCHCICGNSVLASTAQLKEGKVRSCGCVDARLFCVYKHISPDGKVYIGTTSRMPKTTWFSGQRYRSQYAFHKAIDNYGGESTFRTSFQHFYYTPDGEWKQYSRSIPFLETNFFSEEEAEELKRRFIKEYRSLEPEYGYNATSGGKHGFSYSDAAKERTSKTKSGEDGRSVWCAYIHTNRLNGKKYVGVTSRDPLTRWGNGNGYRRPAKQGISTSHFDRAIKKYGWDNFDHEIVRRGMTKDEAAELEKELIERFDTTNPQKGYNITHGGDGSEGALHTQETKEKLSKLAKERAAKGNINFKGQHHSEETKSILRQKAKMRCAEGLNPFKGKHHSDDTKRVLSEKNSQPVNQYSLSGEFIRQFPSGLQAAKELGVTPTAINDAVHGKTRFCANYIWRKSDDAPPIGEPIDAYAILGNDRHYGLKKAVDQFTMDGVFVCRYASLADAAEAVGGTVSNISAAAWGRGHTKSCKGFKWKFVDDQSTNPLFAPSFDSKAKSEEKGSRIG